MRRAGGNGAPTGRKAKKTPRHGRRNLEDMEYLETLTIVLEPPAVAAGAMRIGEDVSYKYEHPRTRAVRLTMDRPI